MNINNHIDNSHDNDKNCSEDVIVGKYSCKKEIRIPILLKLFVNLLILIPKAIIFFVGSIVTIISIPFEILGNWISKICSLIIGLTLFAIIIGLCGFVEMEFNLLLLTGFGSLIVLGSIGVIFGDSLGTLIAKLGVNISALSGYLKFMALSRK